MHTPPCTLPLPDPGNLCCPICPSAPSAESHWGWSLCLRLPILLPLPESKIFGCCPEGLPPPHRSQQQRVIPLQLADQGGTRLPPSQLGKGNRPAGFQRYFAKRKRKTRTNKQSKKETHTPTPHLKKRTKQSPRRLLVVFPAPPVALGFWQAWASGATFCSLPSSPGIALAKPHGACATHLKQLGLN